MKLSILALATLSLWAEESKPPKKMADAITLSAITSKNSILQWTGIPGNDSDSFRIAYDNGDVVVSRLHGPELVRLSPDGKVIIATGSSLEDALKLILRGLATAYPELKPTKKGSK